MHFQSEDWDRTLCKFSKKNCDIRGVGEQKATMCRMHLSPLFRYDIFFVQKIKGAIDHNKKVMHIKKSLFWKKKVDLIMKS